MKVYLAAPWKHRQTALEAAQFFERAGISITSDWHNWTGDEDNPTILAAEAAKDWLDIKEADTIVILNIEKSEGKAVETGMGLAYGKRIVVVGTERFNVFQYLPQVEFVATLEDAADLLTKIPRLFSRLPRLLSPTFSPAPRDSEPASKL